MINKKQKGEWNIFFSEQYRLKNLKQSILIITGQPEKWKYWIRKTYKNAFKKKYIKKPNMAYYQKHKLARSRYFIYDSPYIEITVMCPEHGYHSYSNTSPMYEHVIFDYYYEDVKKIAQEIFHDSNLHEEDMGVSLPQIYYTKSHYRENHKKY